MLPGAGLAGQVGLARRGPEGSRRQCGAAAGLRWHRPGGAGSRGRRRTRDRWRTPRRLGQRPGRTVWPRRRGPNRLIELAVIVLRLAPTMTADAIPGWLNAAVPVLEGQRAVELVAGAVGARRVRRRELRVSRLHPASRVAPVGFEDRKAHRIRRQQCRSPRRRQLGSRSDARLHSRGPPSPRLVPRSPLEHGRGRHQRPLRRRPPSPASRRPSSGFANSTSGSSTRASARGAGRSTSTSPPSRRSPTPWSGVPDRATSSGSRASRPPRRTSFAT